MIYYTDSTSLSTATSIYTDVNLTTLAADGYYSDKSVSRRQVSGILQAPETCTNCSGPIGTLTLSWSINGTAGGNLTIKSGVTELLNINSISGEAQSGVLYLTPAQASNVIFSGYNYASSGPSRFRVCDITNGSQIFYSGDIGYGNTIYAPTTGSYNLSASTSVSLTVNATPFICPVA
jgi:hypothetical protein